uniref:Uncharacterized protein n=1 Tax=Corethron hystrix TaxID=216773 RepID=A0A7S1FQW4_9STRA|mmetsp:Transcript_24144/g.54864  ORF Transcript_24144/g.54864 Transcript_24144/m.54864 type:complete len:113 (+) Transcript_24144:162-500(+)
MPHFCGTDLYGYIRDFTVWFSSAKSYVVSYFLSSRRSCHNVQLIDLLLVGFGTFWVQTLCNISLVYKHTYKSIVSFSMKTMQSKKIIIHVRQMTMPHSCGSDLNGYLRDNVS